MKYSKYWNRLLSNLVDKLGVCPISSGIFHWMQENTGFFGCIRMIKLLLRRQAQPPMTFTQEIRNHNASSLAFRTQRTPILLHPDCIFSVVRRKTRLIVSIQKNWFLLITQIGTHSNFKVVFNVREHSSLIFRDIN
jgi:hypothetical protein